MAQCLSPWKKPNTNFFLPCGKCYECKARRVSGWSFRLMKEAEGSTSAFFVTLTYDTDHVPITPKGFMTLSKESIQLYFKRLRKNHGKSKIKYYVCGEYGGHTKRPHYHVILFNADDNLIEKSWGLGSVHIGKVTPASCGYTLKYMSKPARIPEHRNDDRTPEFAHMSKGMGKGYLTPQMVKWHQNDLVNRMYVPLKDGKKIAMPRYYKQRIYTDWQRLRISDHMKNNPQEEKLSADKVRLEKGRKSKKDDRFNTPL